MRNLITMCFLMISVFATSIRGQISTNHNQVKNTRTSTHFLQKNYFDSFAGKEDILKKYNLGGAGFRNRLSYFQASSSVEWACQPNFSDSLQIGWARHWASGLAPGFDQATDIVVDEDSNVYVTGLGSNKPFGLDYLTVKYNSSGTQLWALKGIV
ncbi:SBBP repeat-containing protein [Bacteroidota bacterium]